MARDPVKDADQRLAARGFSEVLGTGEVQRALRVSKPTVHQLVDEGLLEAFRVRTRLRFERLAVAHFMIVGRVK